MKICERTLQIIDNIGKINPGIVFKEGNVIKAKKHRASTPVLFAKVEEYFPRDFAIYNIRNFLMMFKLLEEPELEFTDENVLFTGKCGKKASIKYASPNVIDHIDYGTKIAMPKIDVEFGLSVDDFKALKNAAVALQVPEIALVGKDGTLSISTSNSRNRSVDAFWFDIGEIDRDFNIIVNLDNVLQMMNESYKVRISLKGLLEFSTEDLTYYITASDKSKV